MRCLIVDDDLACRDFLSAALEPNAECYVAASGLQALDMIRQALKVGRPYDVVLFDAALGDMSPTALIRGLRHLERQAKLAAERAAHVVALTAPWLADAAPTEALDGAALVVPRPMPFDQQALATAVAALGQPAIDWTRPTTTRQPARRGRFLVIDDDRLCRVQMCDYLEPWGACDAAGGGAAALELFRAALAADRPYDLVTLDIVMPDQDGHAVLCALRRFEEAHGVLGLDGARVVMTTSSHDPQQCIAAFREGCEAYVTKPVRKAELLECLRMLGVIPSEAMV